MVPHMLEKAHQTLAAVLLVAISIVMGPPSLPPLVVDMSVALAHSGHTLEVALDAYHTECLVVGIVGSKPAGSGMLGHISHAVLC